MTRRVWSRMVPAAAMVAVLGGLGGGPVAHASSTADAENYLVLYAAHDVPDDAGVRIAAAGGTLVHAYDPIGVAVANSSASDFRARLLAVDARVEGASPTAEFGVRVEAVEAEGPPPGELPNAPASDADTFSGLQWDMRQIRAPEAHAITGGSRAVVVGNIDTGVDFRHPDLVPNLDFALSTSCVGGVPNSAPSAWDDDSGHGTHTAGTIAAAANGIGIVGVAPNVRLAAIKASDGAGFFYPEAVVCAFMWAGDHHFDVTNNSYFADPFLYNCKNDPVQRAIWKAEHRAIRYAMNQGVSVVASAGNSNEDMAHPPLGNECIRIPSEIEGVITVTANGDLQQKSYYSNYGVGVVNVVAPGGDGLFQLTPEAPNGRVLSTWPSAFSGAPLVLTDPASPGAHYRYLQGTSMAAPHATGVAALIVSRFGDVATPQNGKLRPQQVQAYLEETAEPQPCPPGVFRDATAFAATCEGGRGYNSFYGHGEVDALSAITHDTGNRR